MRPKTNRRQQRLGHIVLLASAVSSSAQVFFKPSPIPENYVEWTVSSYEEETAVLSYSDSTDNELVFYWESGTQDVWKMYDETSWKNCDFAYAVRLVEPVTSGGNYIEGHLNLNSLKDGEHFLACGVGTHCEAGQKMILSTWTDPYANEQSGWNAFVGAGATNLATGDWAAIGGGYNNRATGMSSVVVGGLSNMCISNYATIAGGFKNAATSRFATVLGGAKNTASGRFSLAAGFMAKTTHDYSAAFGFSGEPCEAEASKSIAFCADSFYLNDYDLLGAVKQRRLREEARSSHKTDIEQLSKTVAEHQAKIDELLDAESLQQQATAMLDRLEAKLR